MQVENILREILIGFATGFALIYLTYLFIYHGLPVLAEQGSTIPPSFEWYVENWLSVAISVGLIASLFRLSIAAYNVGRPESEQAKG
jgi:hypothetical protein